MWEGLLACLKKPDDGGVFAFMDERQNVYGRWDAGTAGTSVDPTANLVTLHIDENLRNTKRIAHTFRGFSGEHFLPRGGDGLPVRVIDCATEDALDVASDCVDVLIDEGWARNQIALLTTKERHPVHQEAFESKLIPEYWQAFHDDDAEFYGHVLGFKGLERSVVILCVNGFKDMARTGAALRRSVPGPVPADGGGMGSRSLIILGSRAKFHTQPVGQLSHRFMLSRLLRYCTGLRVDIRRHRPLQFPGDRNRL